MNSGAGSNVLFVAHSCHWSVLTSFCFVLRWGHRYAKEDKDVDVQLLLFDHESFGGFGKGVGEILRKAADVLQNKLTRAQYLDEVTWTTKNWLGLQKQRISVVLHTAIAEQVVNELACGGSAALWRRASSTRWREA